MTTAAKIEWATDTAFEINNRLQLGLSDEDLKKTIKILLRRAEPKTECDKLRSAVQKLMAQNYCTMCGTILSEDHK